jgi:hypothetical protein
MGVSGQRHATAATIPGERTPDTHCIRLGGPQSWSGRVRQRISAGDRTLILQSVVRHYND